MAGILVLAAVSVPLSLAVELATLGHADATVAANPNVSVAEITRNIHELFGYPDRGPTITNMGAAAAYPTPRSRC